MKNWRTTILGCLLAIAIAVEPLITEGHIDWKKVVLGGLIAAFSFLTKDARETGLPK